RPLGYRLFVATGSNHTSDCFTGQDAPGSFALAALMPAPACIGTVSAVDTEDWYRFTAALGEEVVVTRLPDCTGGPFGGPTVPLEVYDPDGIHRGTAGAYVIDKAGDWRIRVATDIPPAPHFEGNYGIAISRVKGVPGHDCNSGADAPANGLLVTLPVQCQGDFMPFPDPSDAYRFALQAGQTVTISLTPNAFSDFPIALTDPTGAQRAQSVTGGLGVTRTITFAADVTGIWRLDITPAVLDGYDKTYSFSISATAPVATAPQVALLVTVPEALGDSVKVGQTFTESVGLSNAGATATGTSLSLSWAPLGNARVQTPNATTIAVGNLTQGVTKIVSWTMRGNNPGSVTLTLTATDAVGHVLATASKVLAVLK